jgi:DDE superfamily endonuclease
MSWLCYQTTKAGKSAIVVNLDETSVKCAWPQVRGNVVQPKMWVGKGIRPRAKASLKQMRNAVTHVALLSDRPDIQAMLPQIFIGNEVAFPAGEMDGAPAHPRVQFWRERSSWNSVNHMKRILDEIARALSHIDKAQIILVFDAAPIHIHRSVLEHAMKLGIWLVCIPAGLTWLLQPLDTHVFSPYKAFLQNRFRSLRLAGSVSKQQWLALLVEGATKFLCGRKWLRAFENNGFFNPRTDLSKALRPYAGDPSRVPEVAISAAQLSLCLPRGRNSLHHTLWTHGPSGRKRYLFLTWSQRKRARAATRNAVAG